MPSDDLLLANEIENHQFTEPLDPAKIRKPNALARLVVRATTGRIWWRVGYTCECVVRVLTTAEQEMLLRGLISNSLDIYQLQGSAAASAGTHSKLACYDIGQDSDEQIDVQRLCGGDGQARTTAQGFKIKHCHGFPQGCTHGSDAQKAQQRQWNNRQNGLISHGPIAGRWPVKHWSDAVTERKRVIVAFIDDVANKVSSNLSGRLSGLQTQINAVKKELDAVKAQTEPGHVADTVLGRDGKISNEYDPTAPNKFVSLAYAFVLLMRRQRRIEQKADQLTAVVTAIKSKIGA